jgi:uncharacterized protein with von Willebrand factor type A (vWA) domain
VKIRLLGLIDALRRAGLRISTAETIDASHAVAAFGVEPTRFREALAACLIKNEADRGVFDDVFDRFFNVPARATRKRRLQSAVDGEGKRPQSEKDGEGRQTMQQDRHRRPDARALLQEEDKDQAAHRQRSAPSTALLDTPLKDLSPRELENCDLLVAQLAERLRRYASRRLLVRKTGRLDVRRTIRRSIGSGGVPLHPILRERRPARPDLVALCDLSHSVAAATRLFLALLGPAPAFFRRVCTFGYVDTPFEICLQHGHLVHDSSIDLHARSDFGNVLRLFFERQAQSVTRNTVVLVLGDARNNTRPSRADLWRRLCQRAQRSVWLNPEREDVWGTGDSAFSAYRPYCDEVLAAATLRQLHLAIRKLTA